MSQPKEVKSINIGSIFDKKTTAENLNKPLIAVAGVAYTYFVHNTKYGESTGFKGDFVCRNLLTGEVQTAPAIFVPKGLCAEILAKLKDGQSEVEFQAMISAIPTDKNTQGYAWVADAPVTESRLQRRAQLLSMVTDGGQLALPLPSKKK